MSSVLEAAKPRSETPFRYDMVGSFLRPQALKEAREKFSNGAISSSELKQVEDQEIIKLVEKQKSVGKPLRTGSSDVPGGILILCGDWMAWKKPRQTGAIHSRAWRREQRQRD